VFWLLAGSFFICGLSTNGLIQTHFISLCGDAGLGPVPAASVLAMMGAFDLIGTILSGWLSDRYDNRKLLFWYYSLRGLSLLWLPYSDFTLYGLSIFAMFYGLDWIATVPRPCAWSQRPSARRKRAWCSAGFSQPTNWVLQSLRSGQGRCVRCCLPIIRRCSRRALPAWWLA